MSHGTSAQILPVMKPSMCHLWAAVASLRLLVAGMLQLWGPEPVRPSAGPPPISSMVDDSGTDEEFPLPNVKTAILSKVIDSCKRYKDNPPEEIQKPLKSTSTSTCWTSGARRWLR